MNMKRVHANHIIAELKSQLAHCEEVQKQQHKELLAHQDLQLSQSKEISRLKAPCQEPVVIQADALKNLRRHMTPETKALVLSVAWTARPTPFAYDHEGTIDMVTLGADEIQALIDRVRATAIEDCAKEMRGITCNNATAASAIKLCAETIEELK